MATKTRKPRRHLSPIGLFVCFVTFVAPFVAAFRPMPADAQPLATRMIAAEDARGQGASGIDPLLEGLRNTDPALVVQAVRGLGRFERPQFVPDLLPLLTHAQPQVRRETANALGQSLAAVPRAQDAVAPPQLATVTQALIARTPLESDPAVIGAIAETLGRLPHKGAAAIRDVERVLRDLLPPAEGESGSGGRVQASIREDPRSIAGVAKGLETIIRRNQKVQAPEPLTVGRLRAAALARSSSPEPQAAYARRVAWLAVTAAGGADAASIERGYDDPDAQVRRFAILALPNSGASDGDRQRLLARALKDQSFHVRYDAVRIYSRTLQSRDCASVIAALDDSNAHVSLAAIDALGEGCAGGPNPSTALAVLADSLPRSRAANGPRAWHRPSHALVSLARTRPDEAIARLTRFASHPTWQVRAYAAKAATALKAVPALERLATDPDDNVRYEALVGLRQLRAHAADPIFIEALASRDYQLVLTAAESLEGSALGGEAVPALTRAFSRITNERRETSRDARLALLARLRELGGRAQAASLQGCLGDFDSKVATECASIVQSWTNEPQTARPARIDPAPIPPLLPSRATVIMAGGPTFQLALLADEAPASVARFARLARLGYYNGLTFHRVVPNFVLQGGSPGANEYAGDGPFMRDELGLRSHTRGTIGVSTRGRDTGDAQIFVNLLDNVRLDHEFTVFAEVVAGMDAVDDILEGDVIERIEILERP